MKILRFAALLLILSLQPVFLMAQIKTAAEREAEKEAAVKNYKPKWVEDEYIKEIIYAPYDSSYLHIPRYPALNAYKKFIGQKIYLSENPGVYLFSDMPQKGNDTIENRSTRPVIVWVEYETHLFYGKRDKVLYQSDEETVEFDYNTKGHKLRNIYSDRGKGQYYTIIDVISAAGEKFKDHHTVNGAYRLFARGEERKSIENKIREAEKSIEMLKTELAGLDTAKLQTIDEEKHIEEYMKWLRGLPKKEKDKIQAERDRIKELNDKIRYKKEQEPLVIRQKIARENDKIAEYRKQLTPAVYDEAAFTGIERKYTAGEETRFTVSDDIVAMMKYYYPLWENPKYGYLLRERNRTEQKQNDDGNKLDLSIDLGNEQKRDSIPYFVLKNMKTGDTVYTTGISTIPSYSMNKSIVLVGAFEKMQRECVGRTIYRVSHKPMTLSDNVIKETWRCTDIFLDKDQDAVLVLQDCIDSTKTKDVQYSKLGYTFDSDVYMHEKVYLEQMDEFRKEMEKAEQERWLRQQKAQLEQRKLAAELAERKAEYKKGLIGKYGEKTTEKILAGQYEIGMSKSVCREIAWFPKVKEKDASTEVWETPLEYLFFAGDRLVKIVYK